MNQTFIAHIAQVLVQQGWDHLKDYTLVFPMQRAELYFKQQFARMLQDAHFPQPVILPRMVTLDQLVDDWSDLRLCDEIRSVCLLYQLYTDTVVQDEPLTLDAFYGWGKQLLQDFNSIDMALGKTRNIVANLSDVQLLDALEIDEDTKRGLIELVNLHHDDERMQAFFHHLWQQLPNIYDRFTAIQTAQGVGSKGQCYRQVITHFDSLYAQHEQRTMVFVGFNYLLPAEHEIMDLFHQHQPALFFWDDDPHFHTDPSVYQFIHKHIDYFKNAMDRLPVASSQPQPKPVSLVSAMSVNAQVQYVNQWLRTHHHSGERSAVVITDESVLESVLYALPQELSDKVNITKGYPLKSTSIYAQVIDYLSDKTHDRLPNESTYAGVLHRLEQWLPTPPSTPENASTTWQSILQQEAYCQTLMVLHRFMALCDEGVLSAVTQLRTMRNLVRRCLETISIPFHGEPVEEVQIIGVLETRLLDFDNVLILNVEEGVVPAKATDHSFIPFDLRKAYGMQTHDEEAKIYAYNFFRLIRRAQDVTLLFCEAAGDMSKKSMSRFLMQILLSPDFEVHKYRLTEDTQPSAPAILLPNRSWATEETSTLSLSASALNDYIECPRKFYLGRVLGIQSTEGSTMVFAPNELGTFFHGAIEHAYKTICHSDIAQPTPVDAQAIRDYIDPAHWQANSNDALQAGFQSIIDNYNLHHDPPIGADLYHYEAHLAEAEVVRTMVYNVLLYDAEHTSQLVLVRLEHPYRRPLSVTHNGKTYVVKVGGVIDRLDYVTEEGVTYLRVVDYKTGSYQPNKVAAKSIQDLFSNTDPHYVLQTLLYSSVCAEYADWINPHHYPIMPQLMFTQKLSADKHLLLDNLPIRDVVAIQNELDAALTQTIKTILSEPIADDPWRQASASVCDKSFCPFHLICGREKK